MPSRRIIVVLVLVWLLMVGWQVVRQYGQHYGAPPKMLDALEEAAKDCDAAKDGRIHWTIRLDGKPLGSVVNRVTRSKNLMFNLQQKVVLDRDLTDFLNLKQNLELINKFAQTNLTPDLVLEMLTDLDVDYFGSLRIMRLEAAVYQGKDREHSLISLGVLARARDGQLHLSGKLKFFGGPAMSLPKDFAVKYDPKHMLFNSIAPVDVIPNLHPGQAWEAPMLDMQGLLNPATFTSLGKEVTPPERTPTRVHVLNEVRTLGWGGQEVPCFVVESGRRGLKLTLWVRAADGRVLKQVAQWGERVIEVERNP
jgi:hypothetical protein